MGVHDQLRGQRSTRPLTVLVIAGSYEQFVHYRPTIAQRLQPRRIVYVSDVKHLRGWDRATTYFVAVGTWITTGDVKSDTRNMDYVTELRARGFSEAML